MWLLDRYERIKQSLPENEFKLKRKKNLSSSSVFCRTIEAGGIGYPRKDWNHIDDSTVKIGLNTENSHEHYHLGSGANNII